MTIFCSDFSLHFLKSDQLQCFVFSSTVEEMAHSSLQSSCNSPSSCICCWYEFLSLLCAIFPISRIQNSTMVSPTGFLLPFEEIFYTAGKKCTNCCDVLIWTINFHTVGSFDMLAFEGEGTTGIFLWETVAKHIGPSMVVSVLLNQEVEFFYPFLLYLL